ncbi:Bromodomain and PHD finger-containing protein 3 [Glycine soja]
MVQIARRKKGRPSKADLARRSGESQSDPRRSLRRRSVRYNIIDYDGDYLDDDEEDERRREKKKLKLMAKLNQDVGEEEEEEEREEEEEENETAPNHTRAESREEHAPVEEYDDDEKEQEEENENEQEEENEEDEESVAKGRKVEWKGLHSVSASGAPVILQSGIPLPDKRTLELILDKLQKKDTYGVFADPVDPEELPDYHDVIEHPMDFATVRKKLGNGSYTTLEQFETDVFLICSNAMQYNAPETIYHKQARSIQELGRKKFEKLRIGFERSQNELKSEQKAGSNYLVKKQPKKPLARASQEPVGSDFSSGATLATIADVQPTSHLMQGGRCERSGNLDGILEANAFWIDANQEKSEDVLSGKGLLSKWGRKSFALDESRRASYNMSNQPIVRSDSIFMTFESEMKHLVTVGLQAEYSYARSLARFSASLGPIAWKIASHRIQHALPTGCKFGRGWVGEYEPLPTPILMVNNRVQKETSLVMKLHSTTELPKGNQNCKNVESSILHPVNGQKREGNHPSIPDLEGKPFFGSAAVRFSAPVNILNQVQNAQSRKLGKSENKKQLELNSLTSSNQNNNDLVAKFTSNAPAVESKPREMGPRNMFKHPHTNGVVSGEFPNGKVTNTSLIRQVTGSSPESTSHQSSRAAPAVVHGQEQGLSDPVQLMRMFAERAQKQHTSSNHSLVDTPPVTLSGPSGQRNDSGNASAAAAHAWMSVGAGGFKQGPNNSSSPKNHISADSLYNSTRELHQHISRIRGEFPSGGMPFQPFQAVAPQPIHTGAVSQFPNRPMVFPQLASADQSRFQMQPPWGGLSPHSQSRQKQETLPPDLNIDFESPGSPVKQSPGVLVDSQQPDLALQL